MTERPARAVTEVAVGVLIRSDRALLLADRPAGKPYPGYWEFPGGKIEAGESVAMALARELHEELGVAIAASVPWVTFEFDYPHAYVRLHFERVYEWTGEPHPREGQRLRFWKVGEALPDPLLPAAVPAMRWMGLPDLLRFMPGRSNLGPVVAARQLRSLEARPPGDWIGAMAETRADVEWAAEMACDFALVGPVSVDSAASTEVALGWDGFVRLAQATPLPIFAFGGVAAADLDDARARGAHGIALSVASL